MSLASALETLVGDGTKALEAGIRLALGPVSLSIVGSDPKNSYPPVAFFK